ncbi:transporter [Anaerosacchariphilus polymeriproducens]|uniref:Transporter n=1 Tax=Anaerosacchariphilus polymeriproducens TaxID=1812858 RepID=A0A371ATX8_9FIRM|nr:transporter [Anaerosacchariphilus polymeriproducens]RDU23016.1 transporter [Anaerosacchariphilus polymeriproducens]
MNLLKTSVFNCLFVCSLIFFLFFLLLFPKESFNAALNGLVLWFRMIIPALLPFAIISGIFIRFHIADYFSFLFKPIIGTIFDLSNEGSFCVLAGFLFGYPMGAKIANDLVVDRQLSKNEGEYLFLFCNQASPVFILNCVAINCFKNENLFLPIFIILLSTSITIGIVLRKFFYKSLKWDSKEKVLKSLNDNTSPFEILDSCVMNGVDTILKLGAYIILFSIIVKMVEIILKDFYYLKTLIIGFLEMTNGISYISSLNTSFQIHFLFVLFCVSFGGISCIFQTASMVKNSHFSMIKYLIVKIMTAFISILYGILYLKFIY